MSPYDIRYQAKQYVAEVEGNWCSFRVFLTGASPRTYLFCQLDAHGCDTGLHFPVLARDLPRECRSALANGCGFSLPEWRRLQELTA